MVEKVHVKISDGSPSQSKLTHITYELLWMLGIPGIWDARDSLGCTGLGSRRVASPTVPSGAGCSASEASRMPGMPLSRISLSSWERERERESRQFGNLSQQVISLFFSLSLSLSLSFSFSLFFFFNNFNNLFFFIFFSQHFSLVRSSSFLFVSYHNRIEIFFPNPPTVVFFSVITL